MSDGSPEPRTAEDPLDESEAAHDNDESHPRKRQRVRLSCLECRRRKLSCDRGFPCERCVKSGTPDRCTYETKAGAVVNAGSGVPPAFAQLDSRRSTFGGGAGAGAGPGSDGGHHSRDDAIAGAAAFGREYDRIRKLELEVSQLKNQLSRRGASIDGSTIAASHSPLTQKDDAEASPANMAEYQPPFMSLGKGCERNKDELRFFRGKEFRTRFFGCHNATMAFIEVSGLSL